MHLIKFYEINQAVSKKYFCIIMKWNDPHDKKVV
jgi:hypothetical protein